MVGCFHRRVWRLFGRPKYIFLVAETAVVCSEKWGLVFMVGMLVKVC
jgi:hypothetical protein